MDRIENLEKINVDIYGKIRDRFLGFDDGVGDFNVAHSLIVGMTESGKTTLAKIFISRMKKRGVKTIVLDPLSDPTWGADEVTSYPNKFLRFLKANKSCYFVIDEGGQAIGRYNKPMEWTATTSRHLGHAGLFLVQGCSQVGPIVRGQCSFVYLFCCSAGNFKIISEEWNQPELMTIPRLKRGEFIKVSKFDPLENYTLDFASKKIQNRESKKIQKDQCNDSEEIGSDQSII
jgi:hypothetical protein